LSYSGEFQLNVRSPVSTVLILPSEHDALLVPACNQDLASIMYPSCIETLSDCHITSFCVPCAWCVIH